MNYLRIVLSLTLTFFMTMCDPTEPTLPANETCSDEIKNQGEAGIDCGGPCVQCFDCFSNYCEFLSGATFSGPTTSVTWSWTFDIPSNPQNIYCEFDEDVHPDFEHKIASLSADELKVDFGDYVAILKPE